MKNKIARSVYPLAVTFLVAATIAAGVTGCAQPSTDRPVYRGNYYAYDAYPFGYRGYPGYPYYGAPFGASGADLAVQTRREEHGKDGVREIRPSVRNHGRRTNRAARPADERNSATAEERR